MLPLGTSYIHHKHNEAVEQTTLALRTNILCPQDWFKLRHLHLWLFMDNTFNYLCNLFLSEKNTKEKKIQSLITTLWKAFLCEHMRYEYEWHLIKTMFIQRVKLELVKCNVKRKAHWNRTDTNTVRYVNMIHYFVSDYVFGS